MMDEELRDEQGELIAPLLPKPTGMLERQPRKKVTAMSPRGFGLYLSNRKKNQSQKSPGAKEININPSSIKA
jgi:hypothetical protein